MITEKHPIQETGTVGLVVMKPSTYTASKKYTMILFLAGAGGMGSGSSADLDKLINGEIQPQIQAVIDSRNYVLVAPQTSGSYSAGEPDQALTWALANLSIDTDRIHITGLSLGAGGSIAEVTKSANANKFATMSEIATTFQTQPMNPIVTNNIPCWLFHNLNDTNGNTPVTATQNVYNAIVALTPTIKPAMTIFNATGHGGWGIAYDGTKPPTAPGGQGFTNATFTLYDWIDANTKSKPVSVLSMATTTPPPTQTAVAAINQNGTFVTGTVNISNADINMDGTHSVGYKSARWSIKSVPAGVNIYSVIVTSGGGWITGTATFPTAGTYVLTLTTFANSDYTGTSVSSDLTIVYSPTNLPTLLHTFFVPEFNENVYVYSDGTIKLAP